MHTFLHDIVSCRDLIWQLVVRELKIRYARPLLGFVWSFILPLAMVGIFYLVFGKVFKVSIEGAPFVVYLMSGVFTWNYFQESILASTTSLLSSRNLLKETAFPHYFIPLAIVLANGINAIPCFLLLLVVSALLFHGLPGMVFFFPAIIVVQMGIAFGISVIASIMYVRWRDVKYTLDVGFMLLFYLTPAFYSLNQLADALPQWARTVYMLNPLVCILSWYRVVLFSGYYPHVQPYAGLFQIIALPLMCSALIISLAMVVYARAKRWINDYLSY